jgi:sortase A
MLRQSLSITGKVLIGAGVLILLFTAYQIWGTALQESQAQTTLRSTLSGETNNEKIQHALAHAAAPDRLPTGPPTTAPTTGAPPEGEPIGDISLPTIGINQMFVEGTNTGDLRKGPGHYTGTPLPGQVGNAAIAGHRTTYGHPFYNLDSLKRGDPIVVTTLQGVFVYDVSESRVVSPSDTSVISNVVANWLTLTTCNPRYSASTRLIVHAKLAHSQLFPNSGLLPGGTDFASLSDNLAGDSNVELTQTVLWGLLLVVVGVGAGYAAWRHRRHRWMIYCVGTVGMLAILWFFFGAISPLLPDSF